MNLCSGLKHTLWPIHCVLGSEHHGIDNLFFKSLIEWQENGKTVKMINKGMNPFCESYSALKAEVVQKDDESTKLNISLLEELNEYENVIFFGEAKSHCVMKTLKDIIEHKHSIIKKMIILEDCMSDVENFEGQGQKVYDEAKKLGAKFLTTSSFNL